MNLSEKILKMRKINGFSQDELADKLGITRQSISKWESGQATPELDKILALSEIFDVSTDYLLQPNETDDLKMKTTRLEKQQQEIMQQQRKQQNRQFLIISSFIALLVFLSVYFVGHFYFGIRNPSIILSELLICVAVTTGLNFHYRTKPKTKDIE